jgi:hypothetical protein
MPVIGTSHWMLGLPRQTYGTIGSTWLLGLPRQEIFASQTASMSDSIALADLSSALRHLIAATSDSIGLTDSITGVEFTSPATVLVARVKSVLGASELIHSALRLSSGTLASTTRPRIFTGQARTFLCGRNRGRLPFFEIHVSGQAFDHESYSAGAITQTALLTLHLGGKDPGAAGLLAERVLLAAMSEIRNGPDNLLALGDETLGDLEQGPWGHRRTITFTVTQTYSRTTYEVV